MCTGPDFTSADVVTASHDHIWLLRAQAPVRPRPPLNSASLPGCRRNRGGQAPSSLLLPANRQILQAPPLVFLCGEQERRGETERGGGAASAGSAPTPDAACHAVLTLRYPHLAFLDCYGSLVPPCHCSIDCSEWIVEESTGVRFWVAGPGYRLAGGSPYRARGRPSIRQRHSPSRRPVWSGRVSGK